MNLRLLGLASFMGLAIALGILAGWGYRPSASRDTTTITSHPLKYAGNQSQQSKDTSGMATSSASSAQSGYMWMNHYALQQPFQTWIRVDATGSAQLLEYDLHRKRILSVKAGQLKHQDIQALFQLANSIGFLGFKERYEPPPGTPYEGDITSVSVSQGGLTKLVVARPPDFIPDGLAKLVESLKRVVTSLQVVPKDNNYLRAQLVEPRRAQDIAASGRFRLAILDDQQLKSLPTIRSAVERPGQFVAAGNGEDIQREGFDAPYGYFFLAYNNTTYELTIFSGD